MEANQEGEVLTRQSRLFFFSWKGAGMEEGEERRVKYLFSGKKVSCSCQMADVL